MPLRFGLRIISGILFSLACVGPASAQVAPPLESLVGEDVVTLQAESQQKISKNIYILRGHVEVSYGNMKFFADEVHYNDLTGEVEAQGHVRFLRDNEHFEASRGSFNLTTKRGTFWDVTGRVDPNFFFKAQEVHKIGEEKYRIVDGVVTACKGVVPKWSFRARSATFTVDKTVRLTQATFKIKNIPILFAPFLAAPINRKERSSGFLIPSTGTSTQKGRSIGDAFYWAINRSMDLTFGAEYFTLRGFAEELTFRMRSSPTNYVNLYGFNVTDRKKQGGQSAKISAQGFFKNGFHGVADINYISSLTFRQVFADSFNTLVLPDQNSSAFLNRNFDSLSFNLLASRNETFFNRGTVILKKFPSVELNSQNRPLGRWPFYFSFQSSLEGLNRSDVDFHTPILAQRFDLYPRLTVPLRSWLGTSLTPSFGFRETFYSSRFSLSPAVSERSLHRTLVDVSLDWKGLGLARTYERKGGWFGDRFRHLIEPTISYRLVRGVSDVDQIIRFDEKDVVVNTQEIEYAITNKIFAKRDGDETHVRELLSWKVAQKYYFDPTFGGALQEGQRNVFAALNDLTGFAFADRPRRFSPIVSVLKFQPAENFSSDLRFDYDTVLHRLRSASVTSSYSGSRGFLSLTYFHTREQTPLTVASNQMRSTLGLGHFNRQGLAAAFSLSWDIKRSTLQNAITQVGYNWDCCGAVIEHRRVKIGLRNENQFRFTFFLQNIGSFGTLRRQERLF